MEKKPQPKQNAASPRPKAPRTRSIAWRLNLSAFFDQLFCFLTLDVVLLCMDYGADLWRFLIDQKDPAFDRVVHALLSDAVQRHYLPLLVTEGIFLAGTLLFGVFGIRRRLRPLDELTQAAQALGSRGAAFDETRFHQLESAIDRISPSAEGARLATGDRELAGLEQAVNNLMERMRDSYRQQARFVSDASHELRTPIAVIQGYANLLDRWGKQDEKVLTESIDAIKAESEQMKRLVEQLLFLARGDSGRTRLTLESFDLSAMMREVCEESEMIDPKHRYLLRADTPVPAVGDVAMLKQTARILSDNAAKYTPEGGEILLRTAFRGGNPAFTVQDSGIGMTENDLAHAFERFYRADSSRARETGGTGLGLAIAKWIVDRHAGWFEVLSREGTGTRITVCLPCRPAEQPAQDESRP